MTMKCPVCVVYKLKNTGLEAALSAHQCESCAGIFISGESYQNWQTNQSKPQKFEGAKVSLNPLRSSEKSGLKFCPDCKHVAIKYKVSHDIDFCLDRCGNCGGIWFDGNEWQLIKERGLHNQLNLVLSQDWQCKVRAREQEVALDNMWIERLGREDYARMKEYIEWLRIHDKQDDLLAFQFSSMGLSG